MSDRQADTTDDTSSAVRAAPVSHDPTVAAADVSHSAALRWLAIILALAAVLRTMGLTYQLPLPTGPDHLSLIGVALRMGVGDANPHWFTWPAAPFYFLAGCYGAMFVVCRLLGIVSGTGEFQQWFFDDPSAFFLLTRLIMVTIGVASVAMIYRLGCLLGSRRRGLLAAAMLAVTPVDVILCHYQKAEPMLVLTTLLALAALIRWWQRDSAGRAALAGAAIGLACAVKYNAAILVAPAVATWIYHAVTAHRGERRLLLLNRLALGFVCMLGVFFLLNPYLLIDAAEALHQLRIQKQLMDTGWEGPHQSPVRSYLTMMFPLAFGWVLYVIYGVGLAGLAIGAVRRRGAEIVLFVFAAVYLAAMMTQKLVTVYYPMPMVPALALGAAGVVSGLGRWRRLAAWATALLLIAPAGRSLVLDYRLALPGPLFQAEYWIAGNVPAGDRLIHRHWLPPLLPEHRRRLMHYVWPTGTGIDPDGVHRTAELGIRWMVFNTWQTDGRETELFGPAEAPLARQVQRFDAARTRLPVNGGGVGIWQIVHSAQVPPTVKVYEDPNAVTPRQRMDVTFEGGIALLGVDPLAETTMRPGETAELCTYWLVPPNDVPSRILITGELRGSSGFLADLTHEFAYGAKAFTQRPRSRPCLVAHRVLLRVPRRAKPGEYQVFLGLRDADGGIDLPMVRGPHLPGKRSTVARIVVRR